MKKGYTPRKENVKELKSPKSGTGEGKISLPEPNKFIFSFQEIQSICRFKHYRMQGYEGAGNYGRLQELLREKGFKEDQVKQCLHP